MHDEAVTEYSATIQQMTGRSNIGQKKKSVLSIIFDKGLACK